MTTILSYLEDNPSLHICMYRICSVITLEDSRSHCARGSLSGAGRTIRFCFLLQILFVTVEQMINIISLST